MEIVYILLIGLVVGMVAKFLMPGNDPNGLIMTAVLGVAGAFVASFLGQTMGWYTKGEPAGFFAAVFGAILILALGRLLRGSHGTR